MGRTNRKLKESDLYPPLKAFLETQGYEVKGEIQDCDVMAVRKEEEPVIIELKLNINLHVVLQAVERLSLSPKVYIGISKTCGLLKKRRRQIQKMLRMLGIGLIIIDPAAKKHGVDILFDPDTYRPRRSKQRKEKLLKEFHLLIGDPNIGGSRKRKGIMTAYRQRAIAIADYLNQHGPAKARDIAKTLEDPKTRDILYKNVYGWFERVSHGTYDLSQRGGKEYKLWQIPPKV